MLRSTDPADTPRRRQLIEAAGRMFRANGFRAVTMEAIAARAGVAKATLYSQFSDKAAVFVAVAEFVIRQIADALELELERDGEVDERLVRALIARHRLIFELVDGSPHARELMSARDSVARPMVEKVDAQMVEALAAALREDPSFAKSADAIARTLFRGCIGVSGGARGAQDVEREIGSFVRPYLIGLRAMAEPQMRHPEVARRAVGSGKR